MVNDGIDGERSKQSHRNWGGMETEGRQFSDFYRNSSEELFLKSLMETSIGMPVPTMEMLGFKNLSHNFRTDSEELFRSWLTNGENPSSIANRTRQASRRLSTEIASLSSQQPGASLQKKKSSDVLVLSGGETSGSGSGENSMRASVERGLQASNLYLAKAWFHSSQPMTRSRSSELRRRYAAMQNAQTPFGMEAGLNSYGNGVNKLKEEIAEPSGLNEIPNQMGTFMSPSNSSSSTFNAPQTGNIDRVSSVVTMLKGTLERKKLGNQIEKEAAIDHGTFNQAEANEFHGAFPQLSFGVGAVQNIQGSMDMVDFVNPTNTIQISTVSREASQSESSAAAQSGFEACDGPSNSSQTLSVCESSKKQVLNASNSKDFRERIIDNLKDDRKPRGGLIRYDSVTSAGSVDRADPTKKRRVERSRKMAEAKERNLTPAIPSDMQAVLKRCETLEKEVRSLKLNLSFMNRKDSEQTKQIEELQKQNEELADEKERLLEEIERIVADSCKM